MATMREWRVLVIHKGCCHEMFARATTAEAALKQACREKRGLLAAVRRGEAGWEASTS